MQIAANKMVTLNYILRADDFKGDIIEETTVESPLRFVFGLGMMLPYFETNIMGLKQGDPFEMTLKASNAYGDIDDNAVVDLSKDIFMMDGHFDQERFKPGIQVPMQTASGQRLNGIILEVSDHSIKMDFNHPLAGVDLHFKGNILEVRDATEEELAPMMGCGCDSGCSSNDSCSSSGCCSDGCGC